MSLLDTVQSYLRHPEVGYLLLIFAVFVIPKFLQRFRLPAAITAFGLGIIASLGFDLFQTDETIKLLSTLGIVSLFLHAGLDVSPSELKNNSRVLIQHVLLFLLMLGLTAVALIWMTDLTWRMSILVGLALVTPSTGFILDSIKVLPLSPEEREWIRNKAIAAELVALGILLVAVQSLTIATLLVSLAVLLGMAILIPMLLRFFARRIAPFAPNSEFAFLIILALACAFVTKQTGTYYLVGAFLVGVAAQQFRQHLPAVASERLIGAVELFASFFVPFYFFHSGSIVTRQDFDPVAWLFAVGFVLLALPLRAGVVMLHRYIVLSEPFKTGLRVSIPMLPTLVFTLVIAQLLREKFELATQYYGALIIYAVISSLVVTFVFKSTEPDYGDDLATDGVSTISKGTARSEY